MMPHTHSAFVLQVFVYTPIDRLFMYLPVNPPILSEPPALLAWAAVSGFFKAK